MAKDKKAGKILAPPPNLFEGIRMPWREPRLEKPGSQRKDELI